MEILQTPAQALPQAAVTAIINAPIEKVNIAGWLLNLSAHNRGETPNFANSIENKALTGKYNQPF